MLKRDPSVLETQQQPEVVLDVRLTLCLVPNSHHYWRLKKTK